MAAPRPPGTQTAGLTLQVYHPPQTGAFAGNQDYIEVVVSRRIATFFAGVLGFPALEPSARAVAGVAPSGNCLYGLMTSGAAIDVENGADLSLPGCTGISNAGLTVTPGASVTARQMQVATICSGGGCPSSGLMLNAPPAPDPLMTLPAPVVPGACAPFSIAKNTVATLAPGCYTTISVSANATPRVRQTWKPTCGRVRLATR